MSQFSPSNARSRQQVEGRRDKKQESFFECAQRKKKWRVQVCDVALYEVVRSVWCCARYNRGIWRIEKIEKEMFGLYSVFRENMIKFDGKTLFRVIFLVKKKKRKERRFTGREKPHPQLLWSSLKKKSAPTHTSQRKTRFLRLWEKLKKRDRKTVRVDVWAREKERECVCACVHVCMRACVCVCVCGSVRESL